MSAFRLMVFSMSRQLCAMSLVRSHSIRPLKRDTLKDKVLMATNDTAKDWGLKCLRYEIRDISPPPGVRTAMEMQAEAERKKRAQVLELEGERQTNINIADVRKSSVILASEAAKMDQVNRAQGEAEAILYRAQATARMQAASQVELKQSDSSAVNNNDHFITAEDYKKDD